LNINYQYKLKRREYRSKYEFDNYAVFGYEKIRKGSNVIYKGIIKSKINEPRDRRLEILNCECEAQTIDRQSTVDMSCAAAERNDMNKNHIGRQSQEVESLSISFDVKTCFALETDSKNLIKEAHQFIRFRRSYTISSIWRIFKEKMIKTEVGPRFKVHNKGLLRRLDAEKQ
jgi:hypothetical protein